MLRITIHEQDASWTLKLEGKLCGAWISEVEQAWNSAPDSVTRSVDLTGMTSSDENGRSLLATMRRAGAQFTGQGVETKALISEICRKLVAAVFVIVALGLSSSAQAQNSEPQMMRLTLQQAVDIALHQNPQVAIANLNVIQSQENSNIARSGLLPQASFSASDRVQRGNIEALFGRKIQGLPDHFGPFWVGQAGPAVSAPLFDLTLWHRWQAAKESIKTSSAQSTTARELNAQLVVSQYLGSLRAAADLKAARSRLDLSKQLFDLATDMQKSGVGTGIDTLRANVQYQNERQRMSEAESQLSISLSGLTRLLNLDPNQNIQLADESSFFETPAFDADQSLDQAYAARPEMKTVLSQIQAEELQKRAARDERLPRLSVNGGWSLQGVTPNTMIPGYQYGASLEVPLFTGGRIEAETAVRDIELKKLAETEKEVRNQIAYEVKTSLTQIRSAQIQVEAANLGISLATEGVTEAQDRFRAGVANNIEVVTAQDELARANDNQITALYRFNQARADLARSTGRMEALYSK